MLQGAILAESLRVGSAIDGVPLVVRKLERLDAGLAGQRRYSTLLWFDAADSDAQRLAEALSGALDDVVGWHADFHSDTNVIVVFSGKVFRYRRGDEAERARVEK